VKICQAGEFGLIERIRLAAAKRAGKKPLPPTTLSIGDDAALLLSPPGMEVATTTDMLVEGVHFTMGAGTLADLGYKSLAASLSDLAAMGAAPAQAFLSLALPASAEVEQVDLFLSGFLEAAGGVVTLAGGDTVSSPGGWVVSVTALGLVEEGRALRRDRARVGEAVCVSGPLGDSAAGLDLLLGRFNTGDEKDREALTSAHLRPPCEVALGRWLLTSALCRCAIDISDGLLQDLGHILAASGVGARVDLDRIPLSPSLRRAAAQSKRDPLPWALGGGEDYRLLFTVRGRGLPETVAAAARAGHPLFPIGFITREAALSLFVNGHETPPPARLGHDHFLP
jgi:thiamine-monophosphate kinase